MENLQKIKDAIEKIQAKSSVAPEMKAFITLVLSVIKKHKDELSNLSAENIKVIKDSIAYIEENNAKVIKSHDTKTNAMVGQLEGKMSELKALIAKVKTIKPRDGVDGVNPDPSEVVPLVLEKLPKIELDDRLKIVEKINSGKKDDTKIEAKQIEGIEALATTKNLDRAISILDQRTQFLINKTTATTDTSGFILGDGVAKITVGTIQPTSPAVGDLWYDTN